MASNDNGGSFVTGFLLGGIIGTVVGILLAPKSGSETRADLLEQSETLRARAEELAAKVRERVGPTVEGVRERVVPVAGQMDSRVSRGPEAPESDTEPCGEEATD